MPNTQRQTPNAYPANPLSELAECYAAIGHVFAAQRDWDRAIIWFERALSYVPDDGGYCCMLAAAYEEVGRLPEAISAAAEVTRTSANETEIVDALAIIGRCCRHLGDPIGAFHAWSTLIELRPSRTDALNGLASTAREFVRSVRSGQSYGIDRHNLTAECGQLPAGSTDEPVRCPLCGN